MGDEEGGIVYQLETKEGTLNSSKKYTGEAKATYPNEDRDVYEGEFVEGFRCGWGTYMFKKNGDVYKGQYEQNMKHGLGRIDYASTFGAAEEEGGDEGVTLSLVEASTMVTSQKAYEDVQTRRRRLQVRHRRVRVPSHTATAMYTLANGRQGRSMALAPMLVPLTVQN